LTTSNWPFNQQSEISNQHFHLVPAAPVPGSYSLSRWIVQGASAVPDWVMRTNFARVGAKVISVNVLLPFPRAIGCPHVVPSIDSWT
jgi:hypothetical protein